MAAEGAPLEAEGAAVEPLGGGLWRVLPGAQVAAVHLRAGRASATGPVEPGPGRIAIRASPEQAIKGRDRTVSLSLDVLDAAGRPDVEAAAPEITTSAGAVGDLRPSGPGRFTARFELPPSRHPELAILMAVAPRCPLCPTPRAVGAAVIPLSAAIDLPGHTRPSVRIGVEVGGRTFGPVVADAQGDFQIPIVVPPGERYGSGESIDALGTRRQEEIDLHLPAVSQIACIAWPRALPADGSRQAAVWCLACDGRGRPEAGARLEIQAQLGRAARFGPVGGGLYRARYTAPRGGGGRRDRLGVVFPAGGAASVQVVEIALATGAPAELGYELSREPAPLGSSQPARTWARDVRGDPLPGPAGPPGAAEGFAAPDRFVARMASDDWMQRAELRLELAPEREVAALFLWRDRGDWVAAARGVSGGPVPGAPLEFGSGARAVTDSRGEARIPAAGASETVRSPSGARAAAFPGFALPAPPDALARTFQVPLAPPSLAVDVRARAEGNLLRWKVLDAGGRPIPGRDVRLEAAGVRLGAAERDGDGGRCRIAGSGVVAVIDSETGTAAVVEVR